MRLFHFRRAMTLAVVTLAVPVMSAAAAAPGVNEQAIGRYVVVLRDSVRDPGAVAAEQAGRLGAQVSQIFRSAPKGYAAAIPSDAVEALRRDSRVAFVVADAEFVGNAGAAKACADPATCQVLSTGIDRVDAETSSTRSGDGRGAVNVNVAVFDSGVDATHPELRVVGGVDCSNGQGFADAWGHGTMVAGIVAAIDNRTGVVGVVPGANIWAVRVLNDQGVGTLSGLLCGIDFVTSTRSDADATNDIVVANMSLVGTGSDDANCGNTNKDALHKAICASTAAGILYVAGAGNDAVDFQSSIPAAYREVLTATSIRDWDGQPGGTGQPTCRLGSDDAASSFSNYATLPSDQAHTIAAPGACILSTWPLAGAKGHPDAGGTNGYATWTGTSFASPHVAGIAALCIASGPCAGMTPAQTIQEIVNDAASYNVSHPNYGFDGDPLRPVSGRYYGYLARAALY